MSETLLETSTVIVNCSEVFDCCGFLRVRCNGAGMHDTSLLINMFGDPYGVEANMWERLVQRHASCGNEGSSLNLDSRIHGSAKEYICTRPF